MKFSQYITKDLYDRLTKDYPLSAEYEMFRRFLLYLATGTNTGKEKDLPLPSLPLSSKTCAIIEQVKHNAHYNALSFLKKMQGFIKFEYKEYEFANCLARGLVSNPLSTDLIEYIKIQQKIALLIPKTSLVHYYKGTQYDNTRAKKISETSDKENAEELTKECSNKCDLQIKLLNIFNNLDTNSFTKIVETNMPETLKFIETFEFKNEQVQNNNLNLLEQIRIQPKPFYYIGNYSKRLFASGASITYLKKEVRKVLTKGWIEFDLQNAHLAIAAKDWNIPELSIILENGSFWNYLEKCGCNMKDHKSAYKNRIYAIIYGDSKANIIDAFKEDGISKEEAKYFLNIDIIKTILSARKKQLEYITNNLINNSYTPTDCFGCSILIKKMPTTTYDHKAARSILSQMAQARELQLIAPLTEMNDNNIFMSCLYQFDGFSCVCKQKTRMQQHINKVCRIFNEHITKLGYPTKLTYEINGEIK